MSDSHVFVRPATPLDAAAIGDIHARTMRASLTAASGQHLEAVVLARISPSAFAEAWRRAIAADPTLGLRVFVAVQDGVVVGFAALSATHRESEGEDGEASEVVEVTALEVSVSFQRRGHGSRMMSAIVDTARELGADRIQTWALAEDEARISFLRAAGFGPAGFQRRIEVGKAMVVEDCWHSTL